MVLQAMLRNPLEDLLNGRPEPLHLIALAVEDRCQNMDELNHLIGPGPFNTRLTGQPERAQGDRIHRIGNRDLTQLAHVTQSSQFRAQRQKADCPIASGRRRRLVAGLGRVIGENYFRE